MHSSGKSDPFNESRDDLVAIVQRCKGLMDRLRKSDPSSAASQKILSECTRTFDEASDELSLLRSVVEALRIGARKRHGMSVDVVEERTEFVDSMDETLREMKAELDVLQSKMAPRDSWKPPPKLAEVTSESSGQDDGGGFHRILQENRATRAVHDEMLDRMSAGLQQVSSDAETIRIALEEDEHTLIEMTQEVTSVQDRLKQQMQRLDVLLANMSEKRKMRTIGILLFVAAVLFLLLYAT
jgi:hypothetical protein